MLASQMLVVSPPMLSDGCLVADCVKLLPGCLEVGCQSQKERRGLGRDNR